MTHELHMQRSHELYISTIHQLYISTSHALCIQTSHELYIWMRRSLSGNSRRAVSMCVCVNESRTPHIHGSRTLTMNALYPVEQHEKGCVDLCMCQWVTNSTYKWVTNSYTWMRHTLSRNTKRAVSSCACVNARDVWRDTCTWQYIHLLLASRIHTYMNSHIWIHCFNHDLHTMKWREIHRTPVFVSPLVRVCVWGGYD